MSGLEGIAGFADEDTFTWGDGRLRVHQRDHVEGRGATMVAGSSVLFLGSYGIRDVGGESVRLRQLTRADISGELSRREMYLYPTGQQLKCSEAKRGTSLVVPPNDQVPTMKNVLILQ